jgi:hypothetical protein
MEEVVSDVGDINLGLIVNLMRTSGRYGDERTEFGTKSIREVDGTACVRAAVELRVHKSSLPLTTTCGCEFEMRSWRPCAGQVVGRGLRLR